MSTQPIAQISSMAVRSQLLTQVLNSVRIAAFVVSSSCILLQFIPGIPKLQLLLLAAIVGGAFLSSEICQRILTPIGYHGTVVIYVTSLQFLATLAAILLQSPAFVVAATTLTMIMANILSNRWAAFGVVILGLIGYVAIVLIGESALLPRLEQLLPAWQAALIEGLFVWVALGIVFVFSLQTLQQLNQSVDQSQHLAASIQKLHQDQIAINDQLQQRVAEQEQLLEVIRELESPVVPIDEGVLVAQLVGHLDTRRLAQIEEHVLREVVKQRARLVLIDITGVSVVDSRTAIGLLRISKTIRLLGSRTALTGISSSVAHMLVELELDLSGIETYTTIQAALNDYRATSSEQSLVP